MSCYAAYEATLLAGVQNAQESGCRLDVRIVSYGPIPVELKALTASFSD